VIEIPDEPQEPKACSTCMNPLTYIYVYHINKTIAVIPVKGVDRMTFRLHTCRLEPARTWRHVQRVDPQTVRRGARRASAALAAAQRLPTDYSEEK
jgi:hypothetical protein